MATNVKKAANKSMEQSDIMASSTKQAVFDKTKDFVKQTTANTKEYVDEALTKVRAKTWSEPLGKACAVTGGIVSGLGNFVPGLGVIGGALSLGSKVLNPAATINDVRREQVTVFAHLSLP